MVVFVRRGQTFHYVNLDDLIGLETLMTFILRKALKQSKPGVLLMLVKFTSYPSDPRICEITTLRMYCTGCKRGNKKALFISRNTISRGIMVVMHRSGSVQ